jgi:hypothetical protein
MPATDDTSHGPVRLRQLLTQNRELKAIGVWNFTLPAWAGRLDDGPYLQHLPVGRHLRQGLLRPLCAVIFSPFAQANRQRRLWPTGHACASARLLGCMDGEARRVASVPPIWPR